MKMWLCKARYLQEGGFRRRYSFSSWLVMSYSSYCVRPSTKPKATPLQERRMIDRFWVNVKGGDGGSGNASVRRSRTNRFGKPDGGNGGRGGDVILRCTSAAWDFRGLQHHINGKRGGNGTSKNQIGSRGEDKVVQVPVGTVIHLVEGEVPSSVESPTSGMHLHPWDAPGTVNSDFLESDEQSPSTLHKTEMGNREEIAYDDPSTCNISPAEDLSPIKAFTHGSSVRTSSLPFLSRGKSTLSEEELLPNNCVENNCETMAADVCDPEIDGSTSEEESEEDQKVAQYNFAELTEEGQQIVVALGGEGGLGSVTSGRHRKNKRDVSVSQTLHSNDNFEVSCDENQRSSRAGLPGSQAVLLLELKSIADVGLVGMPNAGKSTLLGAISKAKPAVGHYSFTTLRPNLGKLNYDEVSITVADIPGLIRGAHENRGLGHAFLRHIERTKILVYVVDLAAALDGRKGIPPWEQLRDLVLELEHYREGLSDRPSIVVANKIDEAGTEDVLEELKRRVHGIPIYPVCAVLEEGVPELKESLRQLVGGGEPARLKLENILID